MSNASQGDSSASTKALVDRIASSAGFQRSPRLRELLRYIADASTGDTGHPLTEQTIGVEVFRRSPDYDSSSDTIVRVQVSQLRKRLEHYYLTEGESETLLLEIPRGSYQAVFRPRPVEAEPGPEQAVEPPASAATPAAPARDGRIPLLIAAVVVLSALCVFLAVTSRPGRGPVPAPAGNALRLLWSNLIRPPEKTNIVVADSAFGLLQDILGRPLDLDRYLQHDPQQWVESAHPDPRLKPMLQMAAMRQYTSIGDLAVTRRILAVDPSAQALISVVWARNFNARNSARENAIFLGSRRSNPWVQMYAERLNFSFDYDEAAHKVVVRNRKPNPGESEAYQVSGEGAEVREGYAVLAFLPNAERNANVLILAGTDMEATEAVGNLATTESELAPVLEKVAAGARLPFIEILFKTRRLAGTPQEIHLVAVRTGPK